jgi:hypothetical protein
MTVAFARDQNSPGAFVVHTVREQPFVPLPIVLKRYWLWTVALTLAAYGTKLVCRYVLHLGDPYDFLFFPWKFRLADVGVWYFRFQQFHHPAFLHDAPNFGFPFAYPAPVAFFYKILYLFPHPAYAYLLLSTSAVITSAWMFARELQRRGVRRAVALSLMATALLCSWPLMVCFWVGNMEIVIGFLVSIALYLFLTDRGWAAAVLFGLATGAKLFPFVFIGLFIARKQFGRAALVLLVAVVFNLLGLWALTGSVLTSWHGIARGAEHVRTSDILRFNALAPGVEHSLFGLGKAFIHIASPAYPSVARMSSLLRGYMVVVATIGILLYFLRIRLLPVLNRILCLCVASILFTPLSVDYTLMHLYVPWAMMVLLALSAARAGRHVPGMNAVFTCLLLLLAPLCELAFHGILFGSLLKSLLLVALLFVALRYPMQMSDEERQVAPFEAELPRT